MTTEEPAPSRRGRPTAIVLAAIAGVLLAIVAVGGVAVFENERVKRVTERSLGYDVEVEDRGDDLRVAVLELRHQHRNMLFSGVSETTVAAVERAYAAVLEQIDALAALGISDADVPQPAYLHAEATRYYAAYQAAIDRYADDPTALDPASDAGLGRIDNLDEAAHEIDLFGERLAADSLREVDHAATISRVILLSLIGAVVVVGLTLAIVATRVLDRLRASYAREQAASQELARALRSKTDFIADASHELRTPLTVIRGNADIGLGLEDEEIRRTSLAEIAAEARRMTNLVNDLLFLARSDGGMPPLEREYVPVRWLLAGLTKPADVLAQELGATLRTAWHADGGLDVDSERIKQAILILVDNAARHNPPGVAITLSARTDGGMLKIEVADNGDGIPATDLPMIFDRFYQVGNRRTRRKGGTGLGLAIAKTIVESHDGSIEVDSTVGQGTTVRLALPLGVADALPDQSNERASRWRATEGRQTFPAAPNHSTPTR